MLNRYFLQIEQEKQFIHSCINLLLTIWITVITLE